MPRDNGVTSRSNNACVFWSLCPVKIAAYTAAPYATASSGLIDLFKVFPPNNSINMLYTFGIREDPPTKTIS
jgi:hypothetical protein